jgi:hypothetical protein
VKLKEHIKPEMAHMGYRFEMWGAASKIACCIWKWLMGAHKKERSRRHKESQGKQGMQCERELGKHSGPGYTKTRSNIINLHFAQENKKREGRRCEKMGEGSAYRAREKKKKREPKTWD